MYIHTRIYMCTTTLLIHTHVHTCTVEPLIVDTGVYGLMNSNTTVVACTRWVLVTFELTCSPPEKTLYATLGYVGKAIVEWLSFLQWYYQSSLLVH